MTPESGLNLSLSVEGKNKEGLSLLESLNSPFGMGVNFDSSLGEG